jgi:hypothetical protein
LVLSGSGACASGACEPCARSALAVVRRVSLPDGPHVGG